MTHDYHRPTLTFPKGGYNASQVRLYGIVSKVQKKSEEIFSGKKQTFEVESGDYSVIISVENPDQTDKRLAARAANPEGPARGNQTILASHVTIEMKKLGTVVMTATMTQQLADRTGGKISCGIIVGYAYEGHTYDLPRPKIMILPVDPETRIPDDDSGFQLKQAEDYAVWLVDKLDECAEFEMNQGFVEQLVLEANLPGKRAPNMYVGRMMLGHRSGKLSD